MIKIQQKYEASVMAEDKWLEAEESKRYQERLMVNEDNGDDEEGREGWDHVRKGNLRRAIESVISERSCGNKGKFSSHTGHIFDNSINLIEKQQSRQSWVKGNGARSDFSTISTEARR